MRRALRVALVLAGLTGLAVGIAVPFTCFMAGHGQRDSFDVRIPLGNARVSPDCIRAAAVSQFGAEHVKQAGGDVYATTGVTLFTDRREHAELQLSTIESDGDEQLSISSEWLRRDAINKSLETVLQVELSELVTSLLAACASGIRDSWNASCSSYPEHGICPTPTPARSEPIRQD